MVFAAGSGAEAEERITKRAREVAAQLAERARKETRLLPFPTCVAPAHLPNNRILCPRLEVQTACSSMQPTQHWWLLHVTSSGH